MRITRIIILTLTLLPAKLFSQDITGLWKGTLYNDSTKKYYRYEIGISEEKGKLSGFSHTFFLVGDKEFYGVKKIRIRKADGKIITEDAGLIANNYPETPAKGVKQLNILELEIKDSVMTLTGPFTTNRTREYAPLTGTIKLQRKNDFWQSSLVPHLQELGLADELSFVKKEIQHKDSLTATAKNGDGKTGELVKRETPVSREKLAINKIPPPSKINAPKGTNIPALVKSTSPAAEINDRITEIQQTVYFRSDSLELALYDNGEVDGDTVSVVMNGKLIMPKQGLSTNAIKKTIYVSSDSIELIMYAENLGSIPPNTGLMVVHDGNDIYEVRFSGDLQKNAAVIFRRKKAVK